MRSRLNGLVYLGGALLFMATSPGRLQAQDNAGMMKDEKTGMAAVPEPGQLHGANGHEAAGSVHVLTKGGKHKIHFTSEFKADPAQDVQIVLSTEARPVSGSVTIARLERLAGEQLIEVPANVDPSRYSHLLLWSKKAGAVLAMARIPSADMGTMNDKMGKDDMMGDPKMEPAKDEMHDGSMSKSP